MKILAINGSMRKNGSTIELTQKALKGASDNGAQTEIILLRDKTIHLCTHCLTCYKDLTSKIAPCSIEDDVHDILKKIKAADGIIFSSPIYIGFVSALMTTFIHRSTFTLCKSTAETMGMGGFPEPRLKDKPRAIATIVSAGVVPDEMRAHCDLATPWLKDCASMICNGTFTGDLFAGAHYEQPLTDKEYQQAFLYKTLSKEQLEQAYQMGGNMVKAINEKRIQPYDIMDIMSGVKPADGPMD